MENHELCPFCGHRIDIKKDVYDPSNDWHPTFIDPDSGGDPINIQCKCGLGFCTGTYDWDEFVEASINHNAVKLIGIAADAVLNIDSDDDRRKEESVIQLSYIAGVAAMARVMKEVLKA